MKKPRPRITLAVTVVYLLCVAFIVFWPSPVDRPASGQLRGMLAWLHDNGLPGFIGYAQIEFTANIAMFVPMGYIIATWLRNVWAGVLLGALVSCLIELGQAVFLPARFASSLDVVANTLGACVGAMVYLCLHRSKQPKHLAPSADATTEQPESGIKSNEL